MTETEHHHNLPKVNGASAEEAPLGADDDKSAGHTHRGIPRDQCATHESFDELFLRVTPTGPKRKCYKSAMDTIAHYKPQKRVRPRWSTTPTAVRSAACWCPQ